MRVNAVKKWTAPSVFVIACCFFAGTLLNLTHYHLFGPGLWHPTIACDNSIQHLGGISNREPFSCVFHISNTGKRPLVIEEVRPGCGSCIEVTGHPQESIPPGGNDVIRVEIVTSRLRGPIEKKLTVRSNDPQHPVTILKLYAHIEATFSQEKEVLLGAGE